MAMRMLMVMVTHNQKLSVADTHSSQILQRNLPHIVIAHARSIIGRETQYGVPDILCQSRIHLGLCLEAVGNAVNRVEHESIGGDDFCTFLVIENLCNRTS